MLTLELEGFQKHKNLKVTAQGFTVILGKSNAGKSAIVRAMRCLVNNAISPSYVNTNSKNAVIRFKHNEIEQTLDRKNRINDTTGNLDRYRDVSIGSSSISPIIRRQFDPLFFVTDSSAKKDIILKKMVNLSRYKQVQRQLKSNKVIISTQVNELNKELKITQPCSLLARDILETNQKLANTHNLKQLITQAFNLSNLLERNKSSLEKYRTIRDQIQIKTQEKDSYSQKLANTHNLKQLITQAFNLSNLLERNKSSLEKYRIVRDQIQIKTQEKDNYSQKMFNAHNLKQLITQAFNLSNLLERNKSSLEKYRIELEQLQIKTQEKNNYSQKMFNAHNLKQLITQAFNLSNLLERNKSSLEKYRIELEQLQKTQQVCPCCQRAF